MTLDTASQSALRERLKFYRELGIGPLYKRAIEPGADAGESSSKFSPRLAIN